jgi:hypothetical protein
MYLLEGKSSPPAETSQSEVQLQKTHEHRFLERGALIPFEGIPQFAHANYGTEGMRIYTAETIGYLVADIVVDGKGS